MYNAISCVPGCKQLLDFWPQCSRLRGDLCPCHPSRNYDVAELYVSTGVLIKHTQGTLAVMRLKSTVAQFAQNFRGIAPDVVIVFKHQNGLLKRCLRKEFVG